MLFGHGDIVRRILSKCQLKELALYSPQHVARLEKAGQFPKRGQLGPNRVGWVEDEVLDWLQKRLDRRESPNDTPEWGPGWLTDAYSGSDEADDKQRPDELKALVESLTADLEAFEARAAELAPSWEGSGKNFAMHGNAIWDRCVPYSKEAILASAWKTETSRGPHFS